MKQALCFLFWAACLWAAESVLGPEFPKPQFQREQWTNLSGRWESEFDAAISARTPCPLKLAPLPAGNATAGPAVGHFRGDDAERRLVAHTQLREIRPILALVTAEHVGAKLMCALREPSFPAEGRLRDPNTLFH